MIDNGVDLVLTTLCKQRDDEIDVFKKKMHQELSDLKKKNQLKV